MRGRAIQAVREGGGKTVSVGCYANYSRARTPREYQDTHFTDPAARRNSTNFRIAYTKTKRIPSATLRTPSVIQVASLRARNGGEVESVGPTARAGRTRRAGGRAEI